uniref:Stabilin 2 n=1 Tax=Hippocampus comes TaxID=109280 RepID=A0A3Q2YZ90_HIPCM
MCCVHTGPLWPLSLPSTLPHPTPGHGKTPPSFQPPMPKTEDVKYVAFQGRVESCLRSRSRYSLGYMRWSADLDNPLSPLRNIGCKRVCSFPGWVQKCCKNHYGRDCQVCPGGVESPCSGHGECSDGLRGTGKCNCPAGFQGDACEMCTPGRYGANCTACECGKQGICDEGMDGSGQCVCRPGWKGERCEIDLAPDLCGEYNGGCHQDANCTQMGLRVNCTCRSGYQGDGYSCDPINRCVEETNGGCSDFASCKFTGPNERECECLPGYVGNGIQCLDKVVPPVDRCLEDNGGCSPLATCKDLHYHANTAGVFHVRSPEGKYKMNFSQADAACQAEGGVLANLTQLGDAQQLGMHLCVAGWMEGGKVGYPTRYPSMRCGENHVGVVLYKDPVDQSSTYDAYCYRLSDVDCKCTDGFDGDGIFCNGVLINVLGSYSNFTVFYKVNAKLLFFFPHWYLEPLLEIIPEWSVFWSSWLPARFAEVPLSGRLMCVRIFLWWPIQAPRHASRGHAHSSGTVSAILVSLLLTGVAAGIGYYVFKHKTDAFRFQYFKVRRTRAYTGVGLVGLSIVAAALLVEDT